MSNFDSDNDFIQDDYYETNGNFYTSGGIYQGENLLNQVKLHWKISDKQENLLWKFGKISPLKSPWKRRKKKFNLIDMKAKRKSAIKFLISFSLRRKWREVL